MGKSVEVFINQKDMDPHKARMKILLPHVIESARTVDPDIQVKYSIAELLVEVAIDVVKITTLGSSA